MLKINIVNIFGKLQIIWLSIILSIIFESIFMLSHCNVIKILDSRGYPTNLFTLSFGAKCPVTNTEKYGQVNNHREGKVIVGLARKIPG